MKTKIIYVVTSNENDYYLEQTLLSILSLRIHNPHAVVTLVVDESTYQVILNTREKLRDSVTNIIVAPTPKEYNNVQKSRFIKTSLRKLIDGDFLFIDSDTVISAPLDEVDNIKASVAAVKDKHLDIKNHNWKNLIENWATFVNWELTPKDNVYFNSGVFYVKDDEAAHKLYKKWHQFWLESNEKGLSIDQPVLGKANSICGHIIKELPGIWNCQILENGLRFLNEAKIIHFFSSTLDNRGANSAYLLKDVSIYHSIRNTNDIPLEILNLLHNPKKAFKDRVVLLSDDEIDLMATPIYQKIKSIYLNSPSKFKLLEKARWLFGKATRLLHIR